MKDINKQLRVYQLEVMGRTKWRQDDERQLISNSSSNREQQLWGDVAMRVVMVMMMRGGDMIR